ncbi:nucleotidyl transferase AbiEii/AbiGii toxin family protein [Nocardioides sp. WS12]|uniref:nucleotidyl transferase AbiEii/AbiGii toxin family protein n=1 Tax=Nocardioides sp. WS12 TaxID=2486272 RepID=UPI0015F8C25F|nr:nucleotidyl transferase AbiEii/AbiGii toxin family protein [Nocardioides sp. WS12]
MSDAVSGAVSGGSGEESGGRLSQFQLDLAAVFFALPQSVGFLLAGGGALIAQELVSRETDDLDFFADRRAGDVPAAGEAFLVAVDERGWDAEVIRSGPEFRRIKVTRILGNETETMYVDLALDSPPTGAPTITVAGPAFGPFELATRKTLALFSRAEPRDFTDVHALHQRFDRDEILRAAALADPGFDLDVFIDMLRSHRRLSDQDFPPAGVNTAALRAYFDDWANQLSNTKL